MRVVGEGEAVAHQRGEHAVRRRLHVDDERLVRLDESERALRVAFVVLLAVGQAHRDETRLAAGGAQALDRELREPARRARIDAAADAEHIRPQVLRREIVREEADAPLALGVGVEIGGDVQFFDDRALPGDVVRCNRRIVCHGLRLFMFALQLSSRAGAARYASAASQSLCPHRSGGPVAPAVLAITTGNHLIKLIQWTDIAELRRLCLHAVGRYDETQVEASATKPKKRHQA